MTANVKVKASPSRPVRRKHECHVLVRRDTQGFWVLPAVDWRREYDVYIGQRVFVIKISRKVNNKNNTYWCSRNHIAFHRVYVILEFGSGVQ
jgi:hypothetical protein